MASYEYASACRSESSQLSVPASSSSEFGGPRFECIERNVEVLRHQATGRAVTPRRVSHRATVGPDTEVPHDTRRGRLHPLTFERGSQGEGERLRVGLAVQRHHFTPRARSERKHGNGIHVREYRRIARTGLESNEDVHGFLLRLMS
ncbi:MAG: hypothetical protein EBV77_03690 [Gemmatimonadaceae bacterium]|nr:hypothetical protein [Gemmatimonadaceae bacterium]